MISETHMAHGEMLIRDIIERMRHDGSEGQVGLVELLTGIPGARRGVKCFRSRRLQSRQFPSVSGSGKC